MLQRGSIRPMVVNAVMTKKSFSSLLTMFSRRCAPLMCGIWYRYPGLWTKLIVWWLHDTPSPHLAGRDAAVNIIRQPNLPEALNYPLKQHWDASGNMFTDHFSNMVNTRRKQVKCFVCKKQLLDENWLEAYYQQYHLIFMNDGQLPDGMWPTAGWDRPEPALFNFSQCTWMAINEPLNQ